MSEHPISYDYGTYTYTFSKSLLTIHIFTSFTSYMSQLMQYIKICKPDKKFKMVTCHFNRQHLLQKQILKTK